MSERLMSMVATADPAVAAPKAVERALRHLLPSTDKNVFLAKGDDDASFVVTTSGVTVAVIAFPFPIPTATLGTAIGGEYVWKEAPDVFLKSTGHFLLTVVNPDNDPAERCNQARVLTMVTSAVLSTSKGVGVFWQSADCVIAPKRFLSEAKGVGEDRFASPLWFAFRFYPGSSDPESDQLVCQSRGLAAFLGREIECGPYVMTPFDLAQTVMIAARYMATAGPVFAEGHTLGLSGTEKPDARIHFDWSALGGENQPIFQLRLLAQEGVGR